MYVRKLSGRGAVGAGKGATQHGRAGREESEDAREELLNRDIALLAISHLPQGLVLPPSRQFPSPASVFATLPLPPFLPHLALPCTTKLHASACVHARAEKGRYRWTGRGLLAADRV